MFGAFLKDALMQGSRFSNSGSYSMEQTPKTYFPLLSKRVGTPPSLGSPKFQLKNRLLQPFFVYFIFLFGPRGIQRSLPSRKNRSGVARSKRVGPGEVAYEPSPRARGRRRRRGIEGSRINGGQEWETTSLRDTPFWRIPFFFY